MLVGRLCAAHDFCGIGMVARCTLVANAKRAAFVSETTFCKRLFTVLAADMAENLAFVTGTSLAARFGNAGSAMTLTLNDDCRDPVAWDAFVERHDQARFCHLYAYSDVVACYGYKPVRIALMKNREIVAV